MIHASDICSSSVACDDLLTGAPFASLLSSDLFDQVDRLVTSVVHRAK
jgi:hypothetical protein